MSDKTEYLICFDFPEVDEPWFAGWVGSGAMGLAPTMRTAMRFDTHAAAERRLQNSYGAETRSFGAVVEVLNLDDATWKPGPSDRVEWH